MSRTDKDVPDWYADEYEPFHRCWQGSGWYHTDRDCDLPEQTWDAIKNRRRKRFITYCEWQPKFKPGSRGWNKYNKWYRNNPTWWYHQVWRDPIRTQVRDKSRKAVQEYNGSGDTEVDIADFGRRHFGGWFW